MVNFMGMKTESCLYIETCTEHKSQTKNGKEEFFFGCMFTVKDGQCNEFTTIEM